MAARCLRGPRLSDWLGVSLTTLPTSIHNAERGKNQRQYPQQRPKPTRNKWDVAWDKKKQDEPDITRAHHNQVKPITHTTVTPVPDNRYNNTEQCKEQQVPGVLENPPLNHAWVQ